MFQTKFLSVLTASALIVGLAACSGSDTDSESAPASEVPSSEAPATDSAPDTSGNGTSDTQPAGADSGGAAVSLEQSRFDPVELAVSVGDTVTFTNNDGYAHTVTSKDGEALEFDSGEFGESETFNVTFDDAGTVAYFCEIHPTMRGTVTAS